MVARVERATRAQPLVREAKKPQPWKGDRNLHEVSVSVALPGLIHFLLRFPGVALGLRPALHPWLLRQRWILKNALKSVVITGREH
jgi:hypothetical protein